MHRGPLKGLPREVAVLAIVAFFVAAGFGIVAPAIPAVRPQLRSRSAGLGRGDQRVRVDAVVSALGVGRLVKRLRRAGDPRYRYRGRLPAAAHSPDWRRTTAQLIALRGIGRDSARPCSASRAHLGAARGDDQCAAGTGGRLVQRRVPARRISGPALGGLITEWSLRAPFFIYAGTLAAAGGTGLLLLAAPHPRSGRRRGSGADDDHRAGAASAGVSSGGADQPGRQLGLAWACGRRSSPCSWWSRCTAARW